MAFNSIKDVFHTGASEGQPLQLVQPAEIAALPSGDYPGKTVGAVAASKRQSKNYRPLKAKVAAGEATPSTIVDGKLVDGHTRAAAHLALDKPMLVRRSAASSI